MENKLGNKIEIEILGLSELANVALRNNGIETVQDLMLLINKKLLPEPVIYPKPHNTSITPAEPYVTLKEAILKTLETIHGEFDFKEIREKIRKRYKGKITAKMNSIKPYLSQFVKEGILERTESGKYIKTSDKPILRTFSQADLDNFLQSNIGKEIEFRYKSERPNSDKRWRKEEVLRYDDYYLYVKRQYPSGHRVYYQKQRIIDFKKAENNN